MNDKKEAIADAMVAGLDDISREAVRDELDTLNAAEIQHHYRVFVLGTD